MSRKILYDIKILTTQNPNIWWGDHNVSHEYRVLIFFSSGIGFTMLLLQDNKMEMHNRRLRD